MSCPCNCAPPPLGKPPRPPSRRRRSKQASYPKFNNRRAARVLTKMPHPLLFRAALACAGALGRAGSDHAYVLVGVVWPDGNIEMHLQRGTPSAPLSDGATDSNTVAEAVLNEWNAQLTRAKFTAVPNSTAAV